MTSVQELNFALLEFTLSLQADGLAPRTVAAYRWHLIRLLAWLTEQGVATPEQVSRLHLRQWCAGLYECWQPATIKQAVSAARSFFGWCKAEGLAKDNPALALRFPKSRLREQRTIMVDEFVQLMGACDVHMVKGKRDAALISLLFDSGLRAAEICRLRLDELDIESRELRVVVKGGAKLKGWFGEVTARLLADWLMVRLAYPETATVFVSVGGVKPGTQLTPDGLRVILRTLGRRAGVERVSAHAFRRGFAVNLSSNGVPDNILMGFGRWTEPGMIKRYTQALRVGQLYPRFSPVDRTLNLNQDS